MTGSMTEHPEPGSRPPQATVGLLEYLGATAVDEDYARVARGEVRRRSSRRTRAGRWGLVVLLLFGALLGVSAVQTSRGAAESATSHDALVAQIHARRDTLTSRQERLLTLRRETDVLRTGLVQGTADLQATRADVRMLALPTGKVAAEGPGVRVTVDDAPHATSDQQRVLAQDLQKLVNGLWQAGAEAVAVNGLRLTNLTAIRGAGEAITVDYRSLARPYEVSAIGNPRQLGARLLDTAGGQMMLTLESNFGLRFHIATEDTMRLPAAPPLRLRYARLRQPLP